MSTRAPPPSMRTDAATKERSVLRSHLDPLDADPLMPIKPFGRTHPLSDVLRAPVVSRLEQKVSA